MTCDDARLLFSARIDDALTRDEAAQLAAHLESCPECRAEWARFEHTVSLVQAVAPVRAPAGFVDRVLERARPVPWHRRLAGGLFLPLRIKLPIEAAAIVLVAGLAVLIFERSPEMRRAARLEQTPPSVTTETPAVPTSPPPAGPAATPAEPRPRPAQTPPALTPERSLDDAARKASGSKEAAEQPPASELRAKTAEDAPAYRAERDTSATTPPARSPAAPAPPAGAREPLPSARPDALARPAPPPRAEAMQRAASLASPDVRARLVAADPDAALVAVADAVSRAGGTEVARRVEAGSSVVDVRVPGGAYAAFVLDLHRLGNLTIDQQPAEPPATVSVTVRVTR